MTTVKAPDADKKPSADLVKQYRPLGLKAVLAAALQVKPKPVKTGPKTKQPV